MATIGASFCLGAVVFEQAVSEPLFWDGYVIALMVFCLAGYLVGPRVGRGETLGLPTSLAYFCVLAVWSLLLAGGPVMSWAVTRVGLG